MSLSSTPLRRAPRESAQFSINPPPSAVKAVSRLELGALSRRRPEQLRQATFQPPEMYQQRLAEASPTPGAPSVQATAKLSIIMPAYNEEQTIASAVVGVLTQTYPCEVELIVVDDGSTDATPRILEALKHPRARVVTHPRNLGKGAALRTGATSATGTHLVPFDADLEYEAADIGKLMIPIIEGRAAIVYGVRLPGANTRYLSFRHAVANRGLTLAANLLFDACITDLHTCLKVVPVATFRAFELQENGFGLDTEITARLLSSGLRPFEIPISYHSRSVSRGKKITWWDGVQCLRVLLRERSAHTLSLYEATDPLDVLALTSEKAFESALAQLASLRLSAVQPAEDHLDERVRG